MLHRIHVNTILYHIGRYMDVAMVVYLVWDDDYGMSIHGTSEFLFSMEWKCTTFFIHLGANAM